MLASLRQKTTVEIQTRLELVGPGAIQQISGQLGTTATSPSVVSLLYTIPYIKYILYPMNCESFRILFFSKLSTKGPREVMWSIGFNQVMSSIYVFWYFVYLLVGTLKSAHSFTYMPQYHNEMSSLWLLYISILCLKMNSHIPLIC